MRNFHLYFGRMATGGWRAWGGSELARTSKALSKLGKAKLSALVASTAAAGCALGSGQHIDASALSSSTGGTFLCALSANSLNQLAERVPDARMMRTACRPLPASALSPSACLAFAAASGCAGALWLVSSSGGLHAAGLGGGNIALYSIVYTPLKRVTVANTWVGAVVGAIPPLIGWCCASGGALSQQDVAKSTWLASVLYFWQMPHFMALSHMARHDYDRGGFRMLSQLDPSGRRVAGVSLRNSAAMIPLGYAAYECGLVSLPLAFEFAAVSAGVTALALKFKVSPSQRTAKVLFKAGLLQLPLLMAAAVVHRVPQQVHVERSKEMQKKRELQMSYRPAPRAAALLASERQAPSAAESALLLCSATSKEADPSHSIQALQEAPFPFLPLPPSS